MEKRGLVRFVLCLFSNVFCQCLIDQVGKDHPWGGRAYHLDLSGQISPCRILLEVSDLNAVRAWALGDFLFCLRPA